MLPLLVPDALVAAQGTEGNGWLISLLPDWEGTAKFCLWQRHGYISSLGNCLEECSPACINTPCGMLGASNMISFPRGTGKVGPPLDIKLSALNCTAFRIQWKMPQQPKSPIAEYTVSIWAQDPPPMVCRLTVHPSCPHASCAVGVSPTPKCWDQECFRCQTSCGF